MLTFACQVAAKSEEQQRLDKKEGQRVHKKYVHLALSLMSLSSTLTASFIRSVWTYRAAKKKSVAPGSNNLVSFRKKAAPLPLGRGNIASKHDGGIKMTFF